MSQGYGATWHKGRHRLGLTGWVICGGIFLLAVILVRDVRGHSFILPNVITPRAAAHVADSIATAPIESSAVPSARSSSSDCGSYGYCTSQRYVVPSHKGHHARY